MSLSEEGKSVINRLNNAKLKKIAMSKLSKTSIGQKMLLLGGTVGLSLWLAQVAMGSKKFDNGDY